MLFFRCARFSPVCSGTENDYITLVFLLSTRIPDNPSSRTQIADSSLWVYCRVRAQKKKTCMAETWTCNLLRTRQRLYQLALFWQHLYLYGLSVQTHGELKITALQSENQTFPSIVLIHRLWTTTESSDCNAMHLVTRWTIRLDYIQGSLFLLGL